MWTWLLWYVRPPVRSNMINLGCMALFTYRGQHYVPVKWIGRADHISSRGRYPILDMKQCSFYNNSRKVPDLHPRTCIFIGKVVEAVWNVSWSCCVSHILRILMRMWYVDWQCGCGSCGKIAYCELLCGASSQVVRKQGRSTPMYVFTVTVAISLNIA